MDSFHGDRLRTNYYTYPCMTQHWIDSATEKFDDNFVKGVKDVLNVGVLFITYPAFYALFEQFVRILHNDSPFGQKKD